MPPQDSAEDKTEDPTQRKKEKAREEGQVVHSAEVNNFVVLLTGVAILWLFGQSLMDNVRTEIQMRLGDLSGTELTFNGAVQVGREAMVRLARCALPLWLGVAAAALLTSVVQTGGLMSLKPISPDLKKIDPIQGAKRLISTEALSRMGVALAKITVIGLVIWGVVVPRLSWVTGMVGRSPEEILRGGGRLSFLLLIWVAGCMILVAVADYAWQRYQHYKQLKMTKTEVKEEQKQDEGRPEVREQQQQRRQQIAQGRMMEAVPEAQVVVTNPTRIAVALQWDEDDMEAPKVVAKGRQLIAQRIKDVAKEHGVPIIERKPLAQALEKAVEVGMEVPPNLYYAVAEVLSFVMKGRQNGPSTF